MTHATPEPGLFCTSSALTDSFLLSPSPTLSGLWGVKIPGWLQCSSCLWHFKSCHLLHPGLVLNGQCVDLRSLYFYDSLSSYYNLTLCPLLQCNLRPPQTFVTFIQIKLQSSGDSSPCFLHYWMKLNPDLWLLLTNINSRGNIVFEQYCVSNPLVIQFQVSSPAMLVPCWGSIRAKCYGCILLYCVHWGYYSSSPMWFPQSITWGSSDKLMSQLNCSSSDVAPYLNSPHGT